MRAILIDPKNKSVSEVEYDGNYKSIYKLIDCGTFTVIQIDETESIIIDDEGLFKSLDSQEPDDFFLWEGYNQPLAGKGLILGVDREGESVATKLTVEEVKAKVSFARYIVRDIQTHEGKTTRYGKEMAFVQSVPVFEPVSE